jgi:hypothetical protein
MRDHFLSLFYFYPYRCQICAHRFRVFKCGVRYVRLPADRREYRRVATNFSATVSNDQDRTEARVTDISIKGCGLRTDIQLEAGDLLRLELQIPGQHPAIVVEEAVVRGLQPGSVGLQFLSLLEGDESRLGRFMLNQHLGSASS